jgi:hypothetical protein
MRQHRTVKSNNDAQLIQLEKRDGATFIQGDYSEDEFEDELEEPA